MTSEQRTETTYHVCRAHQWHAHGCAAQRLVRSLKKLGRKAAISQYSYVVTDASEDEVKAALGYLPDVFRVMGASD